MRKITFLFCSVLTAAIIMTGCSDDSGPVGPTPPQNQQASQQRQFVWNAMNFWYFWQADVPKLADNHQYFSTDQDFQQYLSSFDTPKGLFKELQYDKKDRFSFFIPDYKKFNKQSHGIFTSPGFNYGWIELLDNFTIIGYVQYITPDSPADEVGLKRGTIFTKVDGVSLNINNYVGVLQGKSSYTLTLGKFADGKNGKRVLKTLDSTVTVQAKQITKDPVFYHTVIDTNNTKIGYLVYNAFHNNKRKELNQVFGTFKSKGVQTLILDLRYNPGGFLMTARMLGGMISGLGPSNIFTEYIFNDKRSAQDTTLGFLDKVPIIQADTVVKQPMNQLSIKDVYILTSQQTASSSEALINGLKPYMNEILVGTKTIGKNHGEFVLYDSPPYYTHKDRANPDTKFALSPMIYEITNKNHNKYSKGFRPKGYDPTLNDGSGGCPVDPNDNCVREINYLISHNGLPPLRTSSAKDPLVSKAISVIIGHSQTSKSLMRANLRHYQFQGKLIGGSSYIQSHGYLMIGSPEVLGMK